MMKYTIIFLISMIVSLVANATVEKVKIHGAIKGLGDGEVVLLNSSNTEVAKTKGNKDQFELMIEVEISDIQPYQLYVPAIGPLGPSMSIPTMFLFIDSPDIKIRADIKEEISFGEISKKLTKKSIKGSAAMDEYDSIYKSLPIKKELSKMIDLSNKAFEEYNFVAQTEENLKRLKYLGRQVDSLQMIENQQIFELIPSKNQSKVMAFIVYNYSVNKSAEELEGIYNQFDAGIQDCYALIKMQEKINILKGCAVGHVAPDFELQDQHGEWIKLSSLQGKYVLIDFWASWCGPCRKEIPNIKKIYSEFKDKGLQVVGVSTDDSDKAWKKALEEEKANYMQLCDPKRVTSKLYNYSGIPFIILISPEGIILAKNLRGENIREKIAQYLK